MILTDYRNEEYLNISLMKEIIASEVNLNNYEEVKELVNDLEIKLTKDYIKSKIGDFGEYTLKYFINYSTALKNKLNNFFKIIEDIDKVKNNENSLDILNRLDINLNENGQIKKEDFIRILTPLLYNLGKYFSMVINGNNINTYKNYFISMDFAFIWGLNEIDLYPDERVQVYDIEYNDSQEFIPLTEKQKQRIIEDRLITSHKTYELLKNLKSWNYKGDNL